MILETITNIATGEKIIVEGPDPAPTVEDFRAAIAAHVEAVARSMDYDDAARCASYAQSTNAQWAAEATAFIAWRDAVWAQAIQTMTSVLSGQIPAPTIAEAVAALPAFARPGG